MPAALDALVIGLYVEIDDFLGPRHRGAGPSTEADRCRADHARGRAGAAGRSPTTASSSRSRAGGWCICSRVLIDQSGYNRRLRRLAPRDRALRSAISAFISPSFCDQIRLLDSTPVPCGQSRETVRRSEFAGSAGYGYCRSHSPLVLGLPAVPDLRAATGCRSAGNWPPPTSANASSPPRCSSASPSPDTPCYGRTAPRRRRRRRWPPASRGHPGARRR